MKPFLAALAVAALAIPSLAAASPAVKVTDAWCRAAPKGALAGGVMRMRKLADGVALPAGKPVALKPGAEHLMIIGPKIALTPGAKVALTLRFRNAAPVTVAAPVKTAPLPAMSGMSMEHH
jgi:copper(I)-binding protein